ncbi:MAG: helix-turn-helix domain-containing protein [Hominilimicola sp.]
MDTTFKLNSVNLKNNSDYLTRHDVAEYLKISLSSVDKLINSHRFHGKIRIGRRVIISKKKLNEFIENNM